jgi:hypothetical protein
VGDAVGGAVGGVVGSVPGMDGIIKTVLEPILGVVGQVHKQSDVIEDLVSGPLRAVADQVQQGQIWKGPNADRFVELLRQDFLTESVSARDGLKIFGVSLDSAQKAVADADLEAAGIAEEVLTEADEIRNALNTAKYQ